MAPRHTLLIISQVYAPDPAAVGQHITDVAEEMVRRGWHVVVYTAARGYDDPACRYPRRERRHGVEVRRLPLSSFGKSSIAVRLLAQGLFLLQAVVGGLWTKGLARILVSTSPPFAGIGGSVIAWVRRVPLTWWVMDLNPDQMVVAGKIKPKSLPARVFDWFNRVTMRRARDVVVLDRFMKDRVLAKLDVPEKISVVPPWPPTEVVAFTASRPNDFRTSLQLDEAFIVMYSGNHAIQHPLDTLLDAASQLEHDSAIKFLFVGGGAGKAAVESRIQSGATNILSTPYQPFEKLATTLSAADVHVVSMGDEMVGIVHPCKVYGAMSHARPILFFGPVRSHCGDILEPSEFGFCLAHADVAGTVAAIRQLRAMSEEERQSRGMAAAAEVSNRYAKSKSVEKICQIIAHAHVE